MAKAPHREQEIASTAPDEFVGCWYVLHTRPRQEKVVAGELTRLNIQCFLPLVRYRRNYDGHRRLVQIPLFPGYVLLCGDAADRLSALRTNRLVNVLDVPDQARLRADLAQIHRVVNGDQPVDLFPRLQKGSRCRVTSGTLVGVEGVVIRRKGPWKVFVGVKFLGQSAELEIEPAMLELLD
ncbi:MAG: antitermination protein NusG [Planctomycetes bacterium]|nr:antitermination protein NusG [Planctomycetota bacterium]